MKKIAVTILAISFAFLGGQSFAAEHEKSGAMGQEKTSVEQQTKFHSEEMKSQQGFSGQIHKAGQMIGKTVRNQQGEELGELTEIIFDEQGEVQYIILSKGEILGMGGELTPIPWKAANARVQDDTLTVNIEKQRLDNAPTIKEGDWKNLTEQQFQQEIRGYYGHGQGTGYEMEKQKQESWKEQGQEKEGTRYQEQEKQQEEKKY